MGEEAQVTVGATAQNVGLPQPRVNRAEFQGIPSTWFSQSAREYRQRSLLEKELLFYAYDVFGIPFVDPVSPAAGVGGRGEPCSSVWGLEPDTGSVKPVDERQRKTEGISRQPEVTPVWRLTFCPARRRLIRRILPEARVSAQRPGR